MLRSFPLLLSLFTLLIGMNTPFLAQTVFTKVYNNHLVGENIEWDGLDLLIVGGTHANLNTAPTGNNFGFMKVDTLGNVLHAVGYHHDLVDRLHFIRVHPDGGYAMAGYTNHYSNHPDSAFVVIMRTHQNGTPIWAKKYRRSLNHGSQLTGMAVNGDGRIAFAMQTRGSNLSNIPPHQGTIVMLDTAGNIDWHRHINLGNSVTPNHDLPKVHNNLSIDNTGHIHTGWNFIHTTPTDTIRGFAVQKHVSSGLLLWTKTYKAHQLFTLSLNPFIPGIGLYVRDTLFNNGFIHLDMDGDVQSGFLDVNHSPDANRAVMKWNEQNGQGVYAYLFNNRYTPWQINPATPLIRPTMDATVNAIQFYDFAARGDELYMLSRPNPTSAIDIRPVLTRAKVDTIANCFLTYNESIGYVPFSLDTTDVNLALPMTTFIHQDTMQLLTHFLGQNDSTVCQGQGLVWPGDANSDGIANVIDLIYVALAWGDSGPTRVNPTLQWIGQFGLDWQQFFFNGANHKHADANGNGHVGFIDLLAILANYGQTHNKTTENSSSDAPPLYLQILQDSVHSGDTVQAYVMLGDSSHPVQDLAGLAFALNYDPQLVDSGSMQLELVDGWFGIDSISTTYLQKDFSADGRLEAGIARIDQNGVTGSGPIALVTFVTIDNISGKQTIAERLYLTPELMTALNIEQERLEVHTCPDSLTVFQEETTGIEAYQLGEAISLYPNPASQQVRISSESLRLETVEVWNVQGQMIQEIRGNETEVIVSLAGIVPGLYVLQGDTPEGRWVKKLVVN